MVEVSIAAALRNVISRILNAPMRPALSTFADMSVGKRDYAKYLTRQLHDSTICDFTVASNGARRGTARSLKPGAYRRPGAGLRTQDDRWNDGVETSRCQRGEVAFQLAVAVNQCIAEFGD